jgi:hypothetical protein
MSRADDDAERSDEEERRACLKFTPTPSRLCKAC